MTFDGALRRGLLILLLGLGVTAHLHAVEKTEVYSFVKPLDLVKLELQDAALPSLTAEENGQGEILRRLTFQPAARPSLRLQPATGLWDWSQRAALSLRVQNAMAWDLTLLVRLESADGKALQTRVALPAGPAQTLLVPLTAVTPLAMGMRAGPPMPWQQQGQRLLLAETVEGELDAARVQSVTLFLEQPDSPQSILLGRVGTQSDSQQQALYRQLVDPFGQYSRAGWPEKVQNEQQLKAAAQEEQRQLQAWLTPPVQRDPYGGLLGGVSFKGTGFFRTQKQDGRWYLVTPQGHPFFSLGVNAVSAGHSQTYVEGREDMFIRLPAQDDPLAVHYGSGDNRSENAANRGRGFDHGRWFDFYAANRQRIHGSVDLPGWRTLSEDRLLAWGFNTLGNWSDPVFTEQPRLPFTLPLSIRGDFASISTGHDWWGAMPDPFDPRFAMAAERAIAIAARDHRDDPWLIGFFADNELAWAAPGDDPHARYALAYATLRLTTDVPAKRAFLKQLRDKYRNQDGLSRAWGIQLKAWELMEDPGFEAPLPSAEFPAIEQDLQRFQQLYADTYFRTIDESLNWHAPNHLLLGGRFAISTPEALKACARYCDVLSLNLYTREPQQGYDFARLRELDKPVLISEFHFGSTDRGPFWGGVSRVASEEERGPAYAHFLARALAEPLIVGVHWFQYLDQPVTGRLLDGENGHLGLVGITDLPFRGFVAAVRKANLALPEQWPAAAR